MNLLVVNYGTAQLQRLREICSRHQLTVLDGSNFSGAVDSDIDGVIVIGDLHAEEQKDTAGWPPMVNLMQAGQVPLLALGVGFEILCQALGASLDEWGDKDQAAAKVIPTDDGAKIFQGSDPIIAKDTLRWCVDELPRGIAVLARSETGIEAVRSKSKPLYGLQLQPDDFMYASDGKLVFENFISLFAKK
jgi:anthranilate/para-aminobenzoate synthase component II